MSSQLNIRARILLAMSLRSGMIGNTELRDAIGAPHMPACTITWNLNELADLGMVFSTRRSRYNRWNLTAEGRQFASNLLATIDAKVRRGVAARRRPVAAADVLKLARSRAQRSVFDTVANGDAHAQ